MFVVTADQVASRSGDDLVTGAMRDIADRHGERLALPADRNAGDELQALTAHPHTALGMLLDLTRDGRWSVGLGCGAVRAPLPSATREASGPAFVAARDAVTRAKKRATRFALTAATPEGAPRIANEAEPLVDLLLLLRERRTSGGWELHELLTAGLSQREAAARLGISQPAASSRARSAGIRAEEAALPALITLLRRLDDDSTEAEAT